ncbi:MAG: hypothetical protein ACXWWH_08215 [Nitrospira sp.]
MVPGRWTHAEAFAKSDVLVYLTPVTFDGYSSELKKASSAHHHWRLESTPGDGAYAHVSFN